MTSRGNLSLLLRVLGAGAAAIAARDAARGIGRVVEPDRLGGDPIDVASVDSELRFGSAWYLVAGVLMLRAARAPEAEGPVLRVVSAGWLAAAAGRVLSARAHGRPQPVFAVLGVIEVVIGVALPAWQRAVERAHRR